MMLTRSPTFRRQCARLARRRPVHHHPRRQRRTGRASTGLDTHPARGGSDGSPRRSSSRRRAAQPSSSPTNSSTSSSSSTASNLAGKSRLRSRGVKRVPPRSTRSKHGARSSPDCASRGSRRGPRREIRADDDRACRIAPRPQLSLPTGSCWRPRSRPSSPWHSATPIVRPARREPPTSAPTGARRVRVPRQARARRHRRPRRHLRPRSHDRSRDAREQRRRRTTSTHTRGSAATDATSSTRAPVERATITARDIVAARSRRGNDSRADCSRARDTADVFGWSRSPDDQRRRPRGCVHFCRHNVGPGRDVNGAVEDIYQFSAGRAHDDSSRACWHPACNATWRQHPAEPERRRPLARVCVHGGAWARRRSRRQADEKRARPLRQVFLRDAVGGKTHAGQPRPRARVSRTATARCPRSAPMGASSHSCPKRRTCLLTIATGLPTSFSSTASSKPFASSADPPTVRQQTARAPARRSPATAAS